MEGQGYTLFFGAGTKNAMEVLKKFAPEIDVAKVKVVRDKNGKPYFEGVDVHFSVSHTKGISVLAMSRNPIGVDIEQVRHNIDYKSIVARFMTKGEALRIQNVEQFFDVWTKKEAYSKLTAHGVGGFEKFDAFELKNVEFFELKLEDNIVGNVCVLLK